MLAYKRVLLVRILIIGSIAIEQLLWLLLILQRRHLHATHLLCIEQIWWGLTVLWEQ